MMPDPWWSESASAWFGGVGGAAVGVIGGVIGASAGVLVPKGKGKPFVVGTMATMAVLGLVALQAAVVAVILKQPYSVYYPLILAGSVMVVVFGSLLPVTLMNYRLAEARQRDGGGASSPEVPTARNHHQMTAMVEMWGPEGTYRMRVKPWARGALLTGGAITLAGLATLALGKAFQVWFPVVLLGGEALLLGITMSGMIAAFARSAGSLKQALDQQRLDAEALRRSS